MISAVLVFSLVIAACYVGLMIRMMLSWSSLEDSSDTVGAETAFSVIIPFRNEVAHIACLMESLLAIKYDKFEVVLVDDHSDDGSLELVRRLLEKNSLNGRVLTSDGEGKKAALTTGIAGAKYDTIVTTDADCTFHPNWLSSIAGHFESLNADLVCGPVSYETSERPLTKMLQLELMSLVGVTASLIEQENAAMCNGANLAFRKSTFMELNGYGYHETLASGDDTVLLFKMKQAGKGISFVKTTDAMVTTMAAKDLKTLFNQRRRWASKLFHVSDLTTKSIGIIVSLNNFLALFGLLYGLFASGKGVFLLIPFVMKGFIDFLFLFLISSFYGQRKLLRVFFVSELFTSGYSVLISLIVLFKRDYVWKGRTVK